MNPLADHLWQSTLFAGVAGLMTLALRNNHARVRHWLWLAASCKFLIPLSMLIAMGGYIPWRAVPATAQSNAYVMVDQVSRPFTAPALSSPLLAGVPPAASPLPAILLGIWICGFIAIAGSSFIRLRRIRTAVRAASPVKLGFPIRTMSSPTLLEPGVFGIFRPILLLPEGIFDRLTPAQLKAVIAHELCHVRHRDNLCAAIHMFVETVFWFHPLVWWIGKRMVAERERACDEEVLRLYGDPLAYAEGILNVCKLYVESPLTCVSGVTGSNLKRRIEAIMLHRMSHRLNFTKKLLLTMAGMTALAGPVLFGIVNAPRLRAQTQSPIPLTFDVASIKATVVQGRFFRNPSAAPFRISGTRVTAPLVTLSDLIGAAYDVKDYQISGAPGWATESGNRYTVEAKAPGESAPSADQVRLMLQSLLADRFQLKLHRDSKEIPTYDLVIGKNGPKLKPVPSDALSVVPAPPLRRSSIEQLASLISRFLDRPLVDKTGFAGNFEYSMDWGQMDLARAADPDGFSGATTISVAVQEQLGLKLEAAKERAVILVIDHAEKPSEN
jgi:uncharacterized protein (TIGR03435 family)